MSLKTGVCSSCGAMVGPEDSIRLREKHLCVYCIPAHVDILEKRMNLAILFVTRILDNVEGGLNPSATREFGEFCLGTGRRVYGRGFEYYVGLDIRSEVGYTDHGMDGES